ncbi:PAS domain-containing sensor histidine kinase [Zavarzinella formosa]|uniref:PAS domain-containing sensor histidine kinase n=1 Tax=Zavarzinella formosa TaxID=360055 RepID=UPI00031C29F1|nr:PAS domain-containing protein [Zavarzinella formosa]
MIDTITGLIDPLPLFQGPSLPGLIVGFLSGALASVIAVYFLTGRSHSKSLEARLLESQRIAEVGGWEWNPVTGEVWWSEEHYRLFGVDPGTFTPTYEAYLAMVHPEDLEAVREETARVMAGASAYGRDYRIIRPDGEILWLQSRGVATRDADGRLIQLSGTDQKITARKRAELDLKSIRERFEVAVSGARDGIWDWDVAAGAIYLSPRWKEMLGYSDAELSNDFGVWESLLHPDDRANAMASLDAYCRGSLPVYEIEFRMRTKSGDWRWILSRATATRDEAGRPLRMAGSHTDITERRRSADELATNKALLNLFVKHAPAAIAMLDTEMRYVLASDRWLTDYHLHGREIIGRSHYDVFPDIPDRWREIHRRVLTGAVEACAEEVFPGEEGGLEWLQWEARPWLKPGGEIGGLIFFTQLITERKRVEAAMRESEERYRSVVESLAEGIVVQDANGQIIASNNRAGEILGLTQEEIARRTSLDERWRSFHEDGTPFPGEEHPGMIVLKTQQPVFNTLMGFHKPDGEQRWITVNAVPIRNLFPATDGKAAVVTSFHDVTDSRRLNERLLASVREKEVMLKEIHHRVKNNLAITISLFNFQMRDLPDGPGREAIRQAQDRVRTMAIVHEMLYQTSSLSELDLPGYVGQLVRHLASGYSVSDRISIELDVCPAALPLAAAIPFGLILNEVVSNAFKHAFHDQRRGTLKVSVRSMEGKIILKVQDDGVGLPPGINPFKSRSMGLRLVRELANQLDGVAEFAPSDQTMFRLVFPISALPA